MKKRVLFIDRDGTIIVEPPIDHQVDALDKLFFVPGVITALHSIADLDYELVLATNQDGLGTASFPEDDFWPAHNLMLHTLKGEGINFADELIDRSMPAEMAPTRKPRTGMFGRYLTSDYDLPNSYVIGDRPTDVELAFNLGAKAILLQPSEQGAALLANTVYGKCCCLITDNWNDIAAFLRRTNRRATITRKSAETQIEVTIDLDGEGSSVIDTGLKFFDHMLDQIAHHSGCSLSITCRGDLQVDEHHTIEDTAIVLGEAVYQALGSKRGIERYGFVLPMDECRAFVLLDFGGRTEFQWDVTFTREYLGDVPTEMFQHFFHALCTAMHCNLHIEARGKNNHHLIEGVFKAFARALKMAVKRNVFCYELPSSKGLL
jgi:imidazoleglycerol-phosphate dehydratase/histidinol-phosphatase